MDNTNNSNGSKANSENTTGSSTRSPATVIIPIEIPAVLLSILQQNSLQPKHLDFINVKRFLGSASTFEVDYDQFGTSFTIRPVSTVIPRPANIAMNEYNCYGELNSCLFGCWTLKTTRQTLVISNAQYKMSVVFRPRICCRSDKDRVLDIFIPERGERIGWIKTDGAVANFATVYVSGTSSQFTMTRDVGDKQNPLTVYVQDCERQLVAVGKASKWTRKTQGLSQVVVSEDVKTFQFSIGNCDTQTRAVLFATFAVMIFDRKEKNSEMNGKFMFLGILLLVLLLLYWRSR